MKHKDCWYKKILEFLFIDSECLLSLKSTKSGWQVGGSKEGRFCSCWLFSIAAAWILGKNNHTASLCIMKTKASFVATWWIGRRRQCVKWTKADRHTQICRYWVISIAWRIYTCWCHKRRGETSDCQSLWSWESGRNERSWSTGIKWLSGRITSHILQSTIINRISWSSQKRDVECSYHKEMLDICGDGMQLLWLDNCIIYRLHSIPYMSIILWPP